MSRSTQPAAVLGDGAASAAPADALCRRYDLALLDLDGVVYRGPHAVPAAPDALATARAAGMRLAFVTNNASRSPEQIVGQLTGLGVPAAAGEVVTSAQAAATLAADRLGRGARVFVVGGDGLRQALANVGLVLVDRYDAQPPVQAVVQGFSPDLTYEDLAQAALVVGQGADWIATNTDSTLPTARGLQPGNGTLVAAVAAATGRRPVVAGKPERALVDEAVRRSGGSRPLMVGDRLDTDIEGAHRAGLDSLLVLTGVSTADNLLTASPDRRPTYVALDLAGLAAPATTLTPDGVADAAWLAQVEGDEVRLLPRGSRSARRGEEPVQAELSEGEVLAALEVLTVASWQATDAGAPLVRALVPGDLAARLAAFDLSSLSVKVDDAASGDAVGPGHEQEKAHRNG